LKRTKVRMLSRVIGLERRMGGLEVVRQLGRCSQVTEIHLANSSKQQIDRQGCRMLDRKKGLIAARGQMWLPSSPQPRSGNRSDGQQRVN
jgi:hypothetical protein